MKMNSGRTHARVAIFGIALAALVLVGCDRPDDSAAGQRSTRPLPGQARRRADQGVCDQSDGRCDEGDPAAQAAVRAVEDIGIGSHQGQVGRRCRPQGQDINVEAAAGRATLSGTVSSAAAPVRPKNWHLSRRCDGVDNQLTVLR
jgi:hypothetical protein